MKRYAGDEQYLIFVFHKEIPHSYCLRFREGMRTSIDVTAWIWRGTSSLPPVAKVPIGIHTNTIGSLWVDGAGLAPKTIVVTSVFIS